MERVGHVQLRVRGGLIDEEALAVEVSVGVDADVEPALAGEGHVLVYRRDRFDDPIDHAAELE